MGLDDEILERFIANVGGSGVIVKDGYLIKVWGHESKKFDWASAVKPVMSTMLFFAVHEGLLPSVDAPIGPIVQGLFDRTLIPKDRSITFHHLANMTSGYALPEAPGSRWGYNDSAVNLYMKLLFDGVFQQDPNEAATDPKRLGALQFEHGSIFGSREGFGLETSPLDFARIGWFWLNKGSWNGRQVLPAKYFGVYARPHVPNELPRTGGGQNDYLNAYFTGGGTDTTEYGPGIYGFNWWFNRRVGETNQLTWPDAPGDTFQANGHFNKEVLTVIPSLGLVVAGRGDWGEFVPGEASSMMNQNLKLLTAAVSDGPMHGQVMVDPGNRRWLVYNRDRDGNGKLDPFFLSGPGDPENFLYRGSRIADGTRAGDQTALIEKLIGTEANAIYLMAVRSHGGDGDSSQNPFIDSDPSNALSQAILDQWEDWFTKMDNNGILIYFFFYDDGARIWDTGDSVGAEERAFIQTLVQRFQHHKHLIWVVAEEYQERYSPERVSNIAAEIRAADKHKHPIAVHKLSGLSFSEFANDPNIDQFAIQYNPNPTTAQTLHTGMVAAWNSSAGSYNLNMSEVAFGGIGQGNRARQNAWAVVMGGAYVMIHGMEIDTTALSDLEDLGRIRMFFEGTNFSEMAPRDDLAFGGTDYVLALPGHSYIAYSSNLSGRMGLKEMVAGAYDFAWLDAQTGTKVSQSSVAVAPGDQSWSKPEGLGREIAVFITKARSLNSK